jgi:fucose permease
MNTTGTVSIGLLMTVFAFESACFATIFTLSLRGLGRHTKLGGSLQVAAISGGMVSPPIMGAFCAHCAGAGVCGRVDISGVCEFLELENHG